MGRTVLVTGASGFIGSHLAAELESAGHDVRAMTRHPETYDGAGTPVAGDVTDPDSLDAALTGVDVAYYLVHALGRDDFARTDAQSARHFAAACTRAKVERVVYLGGLGVDDGELSEHLRSRREVERLLREGDCPVTVLRAAVVIGHGSIGWEMIRQLAGRLPFLVTPLWVGTRIQPIALPDAVRYLVGVCEPDDARGSTYEIGGPEVLSYLDMLTRAAGVMGRALPYLFVPFVTPRLSSLWLSLVTDVDITTARNLVDSMTSEVIVRGHPITDVVPGPSVGYEEAVRLALADRVRALGR
ncbi:NAD(P)H-binding protein [Longispora sp. NPDC051575]|uniref:NAD(P)H-binding protein n=1 Tax=Longispora sp. NPDC051575 TaxID=3154943 RepID=UPI00341ED1EF